MQPLKIAIGNYGLTKALKDGSVRIDGFDAEFVETDAAFGGMRGLVRSLNFDVAEMPFVSYLCARAAGKPLTAIPVFLTRAFHHGSAVKSVRSGLKEPKELEGRTIGVQRGYTVTTAVWARGILQADYGVDLRSITWAVTDEEHVAEYRPPANVDFTYMGRNVVDLLTEGVVPAAVGDIRTGSPEIEPLIAEAREAGARFFRKTGIYPINHGIVINSALAEAAPELPRALFSAFTAAKARYLASLAAGAAASPVDRAALELGRVVGDPFPYGIEANRTALAALIDYAADQDVIPTRCDLDGLFAPMALTPA